jgi:hypothetical protein
MKRFVPIATWFAILLLAGFTYGCSLPVDCLIRDHTSRPCQ